MCLVVLPLVLPLVLPDWLQYQLSQELYGKQQDGQKVKVAGCFQQKFTLTSYQRRVGVGHFELFG